MVIPAVESDAIGSGSSEAEADPEVPERARVRTYSGAYKLRVLREYEELDKAGKGALLRREGLYSSSSASGVSSATGARPPLWPIRWAGRERICGIGSWPDCARRRPVSSRNWTGPGG